MKDRFLFDVSVRVRHPSLKADRIIEIFGRKPNVVQSAQEQRRSKAGDELPGVHPITYVSFSLDLGDHEHPEDFLSAHLAEPNSADMRAARLAIEAGCSVTYTFGISCPGSSGFELDAKLIEGIYAAGISLSFFIYGFGEP